MRTAFLLSGWAILLVNFILVGFIRIIRKRHAREVVNLVDDSNTSRDKVVNLQQEIKNYQRVQAVDSNMIERLLKANDRDAAVKMEQRILLSKYRTLSGFAFERCPEWGDMSAAQYQLVREAIRQLFNLETKQDAGKSTGVGPAEGGPADKGE